MAIDLQGLFPMLLGPLWNAHDFMQFYLSEKTQWGQVYTKTTGPGSIRVKTLPSGILLIDMLPVMFSQGSPYPAAAP